MENLEQYNRTAVPVDLRRKLRERCMYRYNVRVTTGRFLGRITRCILYRTVLLYW